MLERILVSMMLWIIKNKKESENSFTSDMNKSYMEGFGLNNGIWYQKSLNHVKADESLVVESLNSIEPPPKQMLPTTLLKHLRKCNEYKKVTCSCKASFDRLWVFTVLLVMSPAT